MDPSDREFFSQTKKIGHVYKRRGREGFPLLEFNVSDLVGNTCIYICVNKNNIICMHTLCLIFIYIYTC